MLPFFLKFTRDFHASLVSLQGISMLPFYVYKGLLHGRRGSRKTPFVSSSLLACTLKRHRPIPDHSLSPR